MWTDAELEQLIDDYVAAARLAHEVGYQFVDVKACHGYLLHEFLSAASRPGKFGGDLAGRARLLLTIIDRIRSEVPQLTIGVRLSVFDSIPFVTSRETGRPMDYDKLLPYEYGFGVAANDPMSIDLTEPIELMRMLVAHGVATINITCASPYYNPHLHAARHLPADRRLPTARGSARRRLPSDRHRPPMQSRRARRPARRQRLHLLARVPAARRPSRRPRRLDRLRRHRPHGPLLSRAARRRARRSAARAKELCRTFSDCTTAPRNGLISGCYPLDPHYKSLAEREELIAIKQRWQT